MSPSPRPDAGTLALTIGERVSVLRRRRPHLSQAELARRAGLDRATVSDIERGATPSPSLRTLEKLAQALETDVATLLGEEGTVML